MLKRLRAGKAPQTEVLQAKLNVSQFDTQRNQAQIRLQQDSAALGLIIGETPEHVEVIDVTDNGLFKLSAEKRRLFPQPSRCPPIPGAKLLLPPLNHGLIGRHLSKIALSLAKPLFGSKSTKNTRPFYWWWLPVYAPS